MIDYSEMYYDVIESPYVARVSISLVLFWELLMFKQFWRYASLYNVLNSVKYVSP